jgi:hypothetical protein
MYAMIVLCCICRGSSPSALPSRFAWLVGGLLLHGHLLLAELAGDASVADAQAYVGDMRQLALAAGDGSPEDEPHALVRGCCLNPCIPFCVSIFVFGLSKGAVLLRNITGKEKEISLSGD